LILPPDAAATGGIFVLRAGEWVDWQLKEIPADNSSVLAKKRAEQLLKKL